MQPKAGLPTGDRQGWQAGDHHPGVRLRRPRSQVQPLIKGKGKKVGANDTITFNYLWVRWSDGKVLEQTYGGKPATHRTVRACFPAWSRALPVRRLAAECLLVIPPADGYPDGNATPSVKPGETLVMVVDLLFTQSQ